MTCLKTGQVCELKTSTCPVSSGCFLVCSSQVFLNVLVIDRNLRTDELYWKGFTVGRSDIGRIRDVKCTTLEAHGSMKMAI